MIAGPCESLTIIKSVSEKPSSADHLGGQGGQRTIRAVDSRAATAVSTAGLLPGVTPWLCQPALPGGRHSTDWDPASTKIDSTQPRLEPGSPQMMPWSRT